jgi:hypothetical protein
MHARVSDCTIIAEAALEPKNVTLALQHAFGTRQTLGRRDVAETLNLRCGATFVSLS